MVRLITSIGRGLLSGDTTTLAAGNAAETTEEVGLQEMDVSEGMADEQSWIELQDQPQARYTPPPWRLLYDWFVSFKRNLFQRGLEFTQGDIRVVSLDNGPGPEFGAKAHNLGVLYSSRKMRKMTQPGVAVLQTGDASHNDKADVLHRIVAWLERISGERLGATNGTPLLLAVRSSPERSAPGVAKSVIYVGMNDATAQALAKAASPEIAYRTYAWFIKNFARAVHPDVSIDDTLHQRPDKATWKEYTRLLLDDLGKKGIVIPDDSYEQLLQAADAIADSMKSSGMSGGYFIQRAVVVADGPNSGAGVYFTRSSIDGAPVGSGRFASGETGSEVVTGDAGIELAAGSPLLAGLDTVRDPLERLFGDALDVEYAFVRGALILLQARPMHFSDPATQIHVWEDMVRGGIMAAEKFPKRIFDLNKTTPTDVYVVSDPRQLKNPMGHGSGINRLYAARGKLVPASGILSEVVTEDPRIMFVDDPNDPAILSAVWKRRMAGIITPSGHEYSHVAILARALKIPMLIGFSGKISSLFGRDVLIDEATGALYEVTAEVDGLLAPAPQVDVRNYLKIEPEEIQREVLQESVGMSIKDMATRHNELIDGAINATKKGDFARAAALTIKANLMHIELRKLQSIRNSFVVYAWDHQIPSDILEKYGKGSADETRAMLVNEAFNIDPMFGKLSEYYGGRLRLVVERNPQAGQYLGLMEFYRISAVVEAGSPYLKRWEFPTSGHNNPIERLFRMIFRLGLEEPGIVNARLEAKALAELVKGSQYVEYDLIDRYHDRGLIAGTKVIGVLPLSSSDPSIRPVEGR